MLQRHALRVPTDGASSGYTDKQDITSALMTLRVHPGEGDRGVENKQPRAMVSPGTTLRHLPMPGDERGGGRRAGACLAESAKCSKEPRVGEIHSGLG